MESSFNRTTSVQLEIANIHDFLKGKVGPEEYHQRKILCQKLNAKMGNKRTRSEGVFSQTISMTREFASVPHSSDPDVTSHFAVTSSLDWERRSMSPAESMSSNDSAYLSSTPSPGLVDNIHDDLNEDFENSESFGSFLDNNEDFTTTEIQPGLRKSGTKRAAASIANDSVPKPKKRRNRGPKPRVLYGGNGPMQLWQFILKLLVSPSSSELESGLVEWTREQRYGFRILQPHKLAQLWGEVKKKPAMNFEKLARGLRYYYGKSMLEKVPGRENTYQFVWDISEILGYDPMAGTPAVTPPKNGLSLPDQSVAVTTAVNAVEKITVPEDALPDSLPDNNFSVGTIDVLPDSLLNNDLLVSPVSVLEQVYGMPHSIPTYSTAPALNSWCGLPFPDSLFEIPISDALCGIPAPDSVHIPVSNPPGGFPVDFPSPQVVSLAPSDFNWFFESDAKSSFYEAL